MSWQFTDLMKYKKSAKKYNVMKKVVILGARGFLGEEVTKHFEKTHDVYTMDRHSGDEKHVQGSITSQEDVSKAIKDKDVVVNVVGLSPITQPQNGYESVHVGGVENILRALSKNTRFVHVSAVGSNAESAIDYLRTKGEAEQVIREKCTNFAIVRPNIIFDDKGELIPLLVKTSWLRFFPKIPLRIQPVHRIDVAKSIYEAGISTNKKQEIDVAGLETYRFWEFASLVKKSVGYKQINIPFKIYKFFMWCIAISPYRKITLNQVHALEEDFTTAHTYLEGKNPVLFSRWIIDQTFRQT